MVTHAVPAVKGCTWKGVGQKVAVKGSYRPGQDQIATPGAGPRRVGKSRDKQRGRTILTTPGVPAERLAALRTAFQAMLRDPDFLAACEKRKPDGRWRRRGRDR